MKKLHYLCLISFLTIGCNAPPGENGASKIYNFTNSENESQDNNQIKFSQMWLWEYHIELETDDKHIQKTDGKIELYYNPDTKYWLFTKDGALNQLGEMVNWVVGKPDGNYITSVKPEFQGEDTMIDIEKIESKLPQSIPTTFKPTGKKQVFNDNDWGFEKIKAEKYRIDSTENQSYSIYLAPYNADFSPIYNFNKRNSEIEMAYSFPDDIPAGQLLLKEFKQKDRNRSTLIFKGISHTEYYITIPKN